MNWLVKEITEPFISTTGEKIILIPGGFKPPTLGHFYIVNEMAKKNEIDKVIVLVGHKIRDGITKEQSLEIWNIYKSYLPTNITIIISDKISPVGDVISIIKNNPQNFYYPVVGIRGEEDEGDLKRFDYLKDKYTNYKPIIFNSDLNISGTKARRALLDGNFEIFKNYIPSELNEADKVRVWDILNNKMISENLTYSQHIDYKQIVDEVLDYFKNKYSLSSLPTIEYADGDVENAKTIFTKTGHYNPATKTIVLYTEGRHPRDLINTLCHELIHFLQDLKGELDNIQTQNTMEDDYLDKIEREAYEEGGILFRNWKDSIKNNKLQEQTIKYYNKYKQYFLNELFEKDLPIIDKVSKNLYIVTNGDDIEAKYDFRLEIPEKNIWSLNWFFTPDNKNKSPEAWKQVTASSLRVLEDWLKSNNPKSIHISGNNNIKTQIYKNYIDKLQTLLNNKYIIDNSDEDKIVLRSIEESKQSSIKKRMSTLNESYEQSLYYWQNGDINSKSKVESWNSIKKKIERETLKEIYIKHNYADLLTQQLAEALIPQSPLEKSLRIKYNDVLEKLIIFEKNNHIEVNQIRINNQHKNQGYGTKIMNDIIDYANKTLKVITLTPTNDFGSDELRLIEFYKRLGFVKNKNNREYLDTYIKYPKYI